MTRFMLLVATAGLALTGCATSPVSPPATDTAHYSPREANAWTASRPTLVESYGQDSPRQFGELRMPAGKGPFPVAMLVHGGCWAGMGSPANLGPLADWLTQNGVATWNVDYRELGSEGGWTATFEDWAGALARLTPLAQRYPLDLSRVSVFGHSAGATPVVWLASGARADGMLARDLPKVRGGVVLDGPLELTSFVGVDKDICGKSVIVPLMGGTPAEVPGRYAMLDPRRTPSRAKDMVVVVGALPPPADDVLAALRSSGVAVERIGIAEEHFDLLKPGTPDFAKIAPAMLAVARGR